MMAPKPKADTLSGIEDAPGSAITTRAVCIGLLLGIGINLIMLYNDYYLYNTPLIFSQLPVAGMAVLMVLVFVNAVGRWLQGRDWLSRGEMLLIWAMIGVAGGIGSTGFGRGVTGFIASPAYLTTPSNDFAMYFLDVLPDWMVLSKDPDSKAVKWYFEGLPKGESIPWGMWIRPMLAWGGFATAVYCVMFALSSLFFRRWTDNERLTYPITYLPLAMTAEAPAGRVLNDFFRNPVVWIGAGIPILIHAINGLDSYFPSMVQIPLRWWTYGMFSDRPWSEFNLGMAGIFFSIVGLSFLMTTEMSFSLWFFYILYRLSFVFIAWKGAAGQTGFFGDWNRNIIHFESSGAVFALAGFLIWSIRHNLKDWFRRAVKGMEGVPGDLLRPRLTLVLLVLGFGGMVGWVMATGASWWAAVLGMSLFVCVIIVLTRLVAEAGLLIIGVEAIAYEFVTGIVPASWITSHTVTTLAQMRGAMMSDLREIMMPYVMNGARALEIARANAGKVMGAFALAAALALVTTSYSRISTCYKYGALNGDIAYNTGWNTNLHYAATLFQKYPPSYDWLTIGDMKVIPVKVAHTAVGATLTGVMLFLRGSFAGWPLNPIGFIVGGSWAMSVSWFSIFLGWMAKASVMTFGGAPGYRKILPFFLGLILGEAIIGTAWAVISIVTGVPSVSMLPS